MKHPHPTAIEYKGHRIEITEDYLFAVTGELIDGRFVAMAEAQKRIDEATLAHWKQERTVLTLDVLTARGKALTVRGIHAGNGHVMTNDKAFDKEHTTQVLYPNARWIVPLISERVQLVQRLNAIKKELEPFEISTYRSHSRMKPDHHDLKVAELVEEHTKKMALARTREKDDAPENTGPAAQPTGNDANHLNARGQPEY